MTIEIPLDNIDTDALDTALEFFELVEDDDASIEQLSETIVELTTLKTVIETKGFSDGLIAFADSNNILSKSIPEFPSLETYLSSWSDTDITDHKVAALEGIGTKIAETSARYTVAIKAHFVKYQKYYVAAGVIIGSLLLAALGYKKFIEGKKIKADADFARAVRLVALDKQMDANLEKARAAAKSMEIELPHLAGKVIPKPTLENARSVVLDAVNNVESAKQTLDRLKASLADVKARIETVKSPEDRAALQIRLNFYDRMIRHTMHEAKLNKNIAAAVSSQFE